MPWPPEEPDVSLESEVTAIISDSKRVNRERRMYDALKRIATAYQSPEQLRRNSESDFGLDPEEAIEMAYTNLIWEAAAAIKGMRRP